MQRRLPTVSPSAASQHLKCPRARAFRDIDKVRPPQKPWNASGTRMHKILQVAKESGELPDQTDPEARVASAAIQYWPDIPWEPEKDILLDRGDFFWKGQSDQNGPGFTGDYKFTGAKKNIPGYRPRIKNEELAKAAGSILVKNVQWLTYGLATEKDGTGSVKGLWTYIIKPPKMVGEPTVVPVYLQQTREAMERNLDYWDYVARHLIQTRKLFTRANDVPHHADTACSGVTLGCDFAHLCEITNKGKTNVMPTLAEIMKKAKITQDELNEVEEVETVAEEAAEKPKKKRGRKPRPTKSAATAAKEEPSVNPPESEDRNIEASEEEVAKPVTAKTRKKVKTSVEGFSGVITSACSEFELSIKAEKGAIIPVGAKVQVTIL